MGWERNSGGENQFWKYIASYIYLIISNPSIFSSPWGLFEKGEFTAQGSDLRSRGHGVYPRREQGTRKRVWGSLRITQQRCKSAVRYLLAPATHEDIFGGENPTLSTLTLTHHHVWPYQK